jgi:citrate synthase
MSAAVILSRRDGELPSPAIGRLMDAILVASIDHGATPPSALSARTFASTGASLSASVAAGIMSINRHHGGAIEDCARQLRKIADRAKSESILLDEAATHARCHEGSGRTHAGIWSSFSR